MENPSIAKPRLAATVMLLRERGGVMEVFMIVRHQGNDFASGALVFPGGGVDPEDHLIANNAVVFPHLPGVDVAVAAVYVAAMRETFEECGVLLARARGESTLVGAARLRDLEATQGERTFGQMLAAENLVLAPDTLTPFAHWITPERVPKRFDTYFFLAEAPADQVALHDGKEAVDSVWLAPEAALDAAKAGAHKLVFPTQMNLQKLARYPLLATAVDAARASPVVTVLPRQEQSRDGVRLLRIPLEAGYGSELFEVSNPPSMPSV